MTPEAIVLVGLCAGCSSAPANPETLWLAPGQTETEVELVDHEPSPF